MNSLVLVGLFLLVVGGSILLASRGSRRANGIAGLDAATKVALALIVSAIVLFVFAIANRSGRA
jgi:Tfp pilus assembly protein PilW